MKIQLPEKFIYTNRSKNARAYVKNGILYIKGCISFEELMYTITYMVKGYDYCYYCGCELTHKNRTLDHLYPRRWGGVSIPDNLVPSCKNCNRDKMDMSYEQFMQYKSLKTKKDKEEYYQKCVQENLKVRKRAKFVLERDWLSVYDIRELLRFMKFNNLEKTKSNNLSAYYRNWGQYPHPMIVSSNAWVFKGKHILHHAKRIKRKSVMAIVLDNVVVLDKDTP